MDMLISTVQVAAFYVLEGKCRSLIVCTDENDATPLVDWKEMRPVSSVRAVSSA